MTERPIPQPQSVEKHTELVKLVNRSTGDGILPIKQGRHPIYERKFDHTVDL